MMVDLTRTDLHRLLDLVDAENSATKNRLVSATLSTGAYAAQANGLAVHSQSLTTLRATLSRVLRETDDK